MTLKEFLTTFKINGAMSISEIVFNELNPTHSYFIGINPYHIKNMNDFDFNFCYVKHSTFRKYCDMKIVSISSGTNADTGEVTLSIGCMNE